MNQFIYTYNMLPILSRDSDDSEWCSMDVGAYISKWGRERFDYAINNQWILFS